MSHISGIASVQESVQQLWEVVGAARSHSQRSEVQAETDRTQIFRYAFFGASDE
jgi:hypothetical protein